MPDVVVEAPAEPTGPGSRCVGCSCDAPDQVAGERLLFATRVGHSVVALRNAVRAAGASAVQLAPGLLEVRASDVGAVLIAARDALSTVEADEVRALLVGDEDGVALLAAALSAPTLTETGARVENAPLVPLFADEENTFYSVYQPIVSLTASGNPVIGHEALLRATSPTGPVMPDQLFASAAQAGWLHVLDRVGRTTALRGAAGWLGDDLLFVNFVPTTIYRPEVCLRTTEQAADRAGLRLDQIVFEVTESEQIADLEHLSSVFDYYRRRGCRVALDDLGSGYSSLNKLVLLKPDVVKLDKDIVQALPDPVSIAVIRAIVTMTHSYGGLVLAECVETAEQAAAAVELEVDFAQGWYFGRPERREASGARPAGRRVADTGAGASRPATVPQPHHVGVHLDEFPSVVPV